MRDFGAWYDNVYLGVPDEYEEYYGDYDDEEDEENDD